MGFCDAVVVLVVIETIRREARTYHPRTFLQPSPSSTTMTITIMRCLVARDALNSTARVDSARNSA